MLLLIRKLVQHPSTVSLSCFFTKFNTVPRYGIWEQLPAVMVLGDATVGDTG